MNKRIYKGILYLSLAATLPFISSCTDSTLDNINKDVNHPTEMAPSFIITDIQMKSAFNIIGGDYNSYLSIAIEHEVGIFGQMYDFDQRNTGPEDPSTYNNCWEGQYNLLLDCKDVIEQCTSGNYEGYYLTRGIGKVMLAYTEIRHGRKPGTTWNTCNRIWINKKLSTKMSSRYWTRL